jgi:hypothetical protein
MSAGPEHDQLPQPDRPGLRAAWLGSRRVAVTAGIVTVGMLAGAGVAVAATSSSSPTPAPSPSASPRSASPGPAAPRSASPGPAAPRSASPGPAAPRSASPGPAAPRSASPGPAAPPKAGPWRMMRPGGMLPFGPAGFGPGMLGGLFGAVHGSAVVPKPGGGYQTVAFQNGKVTAVSAASVTLHSADGYSCTYQVTSATMVNAQRDGIGSIKDGNQVIVVATVSGSTATAVRLIDATLLQQGFHRFFGAPPGTGFKTAVPSS